MRQGLCPGDISSVGGTNGKSSGAERQVAPGAVRKVHWRHTRVCVELEWGEGDAGGRSRLSSEGEARPDAPRASSSPNAVASRPPAAHLIFLRVLVCYFLKFLSHYFLL